MFFIPQLMDACHVGIVSSATVVGVGMEDSALYTTVLVPSWCILSRETVGSLWDFFWGVYLLETLL